MKHGVVLVCLLLWVQSGWARSIEMEQVVDFKWRGLTVATMRFSAFIPTVEESGFFDEREEPSFEPLVLIELEGQTRGPLKWFEDYQATVRYLQMDALGVTNAFTLSGTDNGQAERRLIVFSANRLPEVRLFADSEASQALSPQSDWLGHTINPLEVLKEMLQAAARKESCEADAWVYDGKRRYRLTARNMQPLKGREPSNSAHTMRPGETVDNYVCQLTIYAEGRQSAFVQTFNPSMIAGKFAALWPFSDGDRTVSFAIRAQPIIGGSSSVRLVLNEIRVHSGIGAIVGRSTLQPKDVR